MMIAPFDKERQYDRLLEHVIGGITKGMKNDDDALIVCAGDAGTGKTRLMFHAYTMYAGTQASITQIAMNPRDFAITLDTARQLKEKRFAGYDEANVSKRDALTKWNKKLIDLYMNIRGLNIFHWWNNPSVEVLDKPFIEERIKGTIFILTKDKNKPRLYYYFTKEGLLQLLEAKGNLKKRTIVKYGGQYAFYLGWFLDYQGPLLDAYRGMKNDRMAEKVIAFRQEFAPTEKLSVQGYADAAKIGRATATSIIDYGVESALLKEDEHYTVSGTGHLSLLQKGVEACDHIRINELYKGQKVITSKRGKQFRRVLPVVHNIYPSGELER
jgi:hypothetical protein